MNVFDLAIVVLFLVVFTVGFFSGFSRLVVALISLFLGLVSASIGYGGFAAVLMGAAPSMTDWTADVASFFVVTLIIGGLVFYAILWSFRVTALRTRHLLEWRGGTWGLIGLALLSVVLAVVVVTTAVQVSDWTVSQFPPSQNVTIAVRSSLQESILAANAMRLSPYLYDAVGAWVPGGPPPILKPAGG